MTTLSHLKEAKVLLSANKAAEAHKLIETMVYSLLDADNPRQAARVNLIFLGRLEARQSRAPSNVVQPAGSSVFSAADLNREMADREAAKAADDLRQSQ